MQQQSKKINFAIAGDLQTLTGGYIYDRKMIEAWRQSNIEVVHIELPASFPFPSAADLEKTASILEAISSGVLLIDALAFSVLPPSLLARLPRPLAVLVHHPLGLETGLAREVANDLIAKERLALRHVDLIFVTSPITAQTLQDDFAVTPERIIVVEPGNDEAARAEGSGGEMIKLTAVGSLIPRKGHAILLQALGQCRDLDWSLDLIGSPLRDPATAAALQALACQLGLSERVHFCGEFSPDRLSAFYHHVDLFVLPSLYEGYGMVLGDAMIRGLPIITTTGGASVQTVPEGAAIKVPPGDVDALAGALRLLLQNPELRKTLAQSAFVAGQNLPRWPESAKRMAMALLSS